MSVLVRKTIFDRTIRNQPFSASSKSFIKKQNQKLVGINLELCNE